MCHAQLVLPPQLHIVLNTPGWWEGELRGPQDAKATPVQTHTHTCSNIKLLSTITEKLANYQKTESRDTDKPWCSYTQKMKINSFQQSEFCSCSPVSWGPHGNWALCPLFCAQYFVCLGLQSPRPRTNPPRDTKCEQQQIPALNRTQAHSQPEFYWDRGKKPSCIILLAKVSSTAAWKAVNNSLSITGNVLQMKRL